MNIVQFLEMYYLCLRVLSVLLHQYEVVCHNLKLKQNSIYVLQFYAML